MNQKKVLMIIRGFCIAQFAAVLLLVIKDGVLKNEMVYVLLSAMFGLVVDGFSQTVLKAAIFGREKEKLDIEFDQLMKDFKKDLQDKN